jgi:integrase
VQTSHAGYSASILAARCLRKILLGSIFSLEALVTIMLAYGLRRGEALGLHWDRLDWAAGTLVVSHSVKRIKERDPQPGGRRTRP